MSLQESNEDIHAIMARAKAARARLRNLAPQPQRVVNVEAAPIVPEEPKVTPVEQYSPPSWAEFQVRVVWGKDSVASRCDVRDVDLLSVAKIKEVLCREFGIAPRDLTSSRRNAALARPRQIGYYLAREFTGRSLPVIGREFGRADHTSVLHGIRRIEALIETDTNIRGHVERIRAILQREEEQLAEWKASRTANFVVAA